MGFDSHQPCLKRSLDDPMTFVNSPSRDVIKHCTTMLRLIISDAVTDHFMVVILDESRAALIEKVDQFLQSVQPVWDSL